MELVRLILVISFGRGWFAKTIISARILCMSKIAGILLILLGGAMIFVGSREFNSPVHLTPYAAWSSMGLGVIMALTGFGHFRAPHKSFLISVPVLITFVLQTYSIGLFFNVQNLLLFVGGHILLAGMILFLSYSGYRKSQTA